MFGLAGVFFLMAWIFTNALVPDSHFRQSALFLFACVLLCGDYVWSQIRGNRRMAPAVVPPATGK